MNLDLIKGIGLEYDDVAHWIQGQPVLVGDFNQDSHNASNFFMMTKSLLDKLPRRPRRTDREEQAVQLLTGTARAVREDFLKKHVVELYSQITHNHTLSVPIADLVYEVARIVPGLTPTREEVDAEATKMLKDKEDVEIDQGIFLAHVLSQERAGSHLCHTMLLPGKESQEKLEYLQKHGSIDLGLASVETRDDISWVTIKNPEFLNAEDNFLIGPLEEAIDLAIMDDRSSIAVLRGDISNHPKYQGQRVLTAGLNINHLYHGKMPYLWYLQRDLGYIHKIFRGLAYPDRPADDVFGVTMEKPFIGQVDSFAIGSGCQFLLVCDYAVAADQAYLTLPASKEGVVPGVASLRLPRFVGERIAHQLLLMGRRINCTEPEALLICDEIAPADQVEARVIEAARTMMSPGIACVIANRRAYRVSNEPLNLFREYMSVYARDEAYLHFSESLVKNLEKLDVATKTT